MRSQTFQLFRVRVVNLATLVMLTGVTASCGHVGIDLDGTQAAADAAATASGVYTGVPSVDVTTEPKPSDSSESPVPSISVPISDASAHDASSDASIGDAGGGHMSDAGASDAPITDATTTRDAAPFDASHDPDHDAGLHDGSLEPDRDASLTDAGDAGDAGDGRSCPGNQDCHIRCLSEPCIVACGPGSTCTIEVGNVAEAKVDCAVGATCNFELTTQADTQLICLGEGACHANCGDALSCLLACDDPQECVLDCGNSHDCQLGCGDLASCFLLHDNPITTIGLDCPGDAAASLLCTQSLLTCNADCP